MPWGRSYGFGRGRWAGWPGNPSWFCRFFPWLPRRWWTMPGYAQYAYPPVAGGYPWTAPTAVSEVEALKQQAAFLKEQLDAVENRLKELEGK